MEGSQFSVSRVMWQKVPFLVTFPKPPTERMRGPKEPAIESSRCEFC